MQELNHNLKGDSEIESSYLNATSKSCQLAKPPTPRNHHSKAVTELYKLQSVFGCLFPVRARLGHSPTGVREARKAEECGARL